MLSNSFTQSLIYTRKDYFFLLTVLLLNMSLIHLMEMLESTSLSSSSEVLIFCTFLIGLTQAWSLISLSVRIQTFMQRKEIESFKDSFKNGLLATPATILYGLIYGLLIAIGGVLFIIPGIIAGIVFFYAPFLAMFGIEGEDTLLNESRKLAKGNVIPTFLLFILCIITELSTYGISALAKAYKLDFFLTTSMYLATTTISLIVQMSICFYIFKLLGATFLLYSDHRNEEKEN
jgi:hypothetical protein